MNAPVTGLRAPLLELLGRRESDPTDLFDAPPDAPLDGARQGAAADPWSSDPWSSDAWPPAEAAPGAGLAQLWARRWRLLGAALLSAALAAVWALGLATPRYLATAVLLSSAEEAPVGIDAAALPGLSAFGGSATALNTEVEILRSRRLAGQVVDRLLLTGDAEFNAALPGADSAKNRLRAAVRSLLAATTPLMPPEFADRLAETTRPLLHPQPVPPAAARAATIDWLMGAVSVRNIPDSLILEVTAESVAPAKARRIANTLARLYLADQADSRSASATEAAAWLADRVEGLDKDLSLAESRLADFAAGMSLISAESLGLLSARLKELRQRIAQKGQAGDSARLRQLRGLETTLAAQHARQASDLATLSQLQREAAASRLIHAHFLGRLKETAARAGAGRAESRLLAAAETPLSAAQPQPLLAVVLAATLAVLALAARIMLAEAGRQTLRSPDELAGLGLPVLGQTLARAGSGKRAARAAQAELDAIAAMLRKKERGGQGKSATPEKGRLLLVTASLPGEGHAALAQELAQVLGAPPGQDPPRVLLIDPGQGRGQGRGRSKGQDRGLQTALTRAADRVAAPPGTTDAPEWAGATLRPHLDQIEVLAGRAEAGIHPWTALLEEARGRYDLVVLAAPPVLTGPLTPLLVPMADAVVHAVAWDRTQTPVLQRALRQLWRHRGGHFGAAAGAARMTGRDRGEFTGELTGGLVLTGVRPKRMRALGYAEYRPA